MKKSKLFYRGISLFVLISFLVTNNVYALRPPMQGSSAMKGAKEAMGENSVGAKTSDTEPLPREQRLKDAIYPLVKRLLDEKDLTDMKRDANTLLATGPIIAPFIIDVIESPTTTYWGHYFGVRVLCDLEVQVDDKDKPAYRDKVMPTLLRSISKHPDKIGGKEETDIHGLGIIGDERAIYPILVSLNHYGRWSGYEEARMIMLSALNGILSRYSSSQSDIIKVLKQHDIPGKITKVVSGAERHKQGAPGSRNAIYWIEQTGLDKDIKEIIGTLKEEHLKLAVAQASDTDTEPLSYESGKIPKDAVPEYERKPAQIDLAKFSRKHEVDSMDQIVVVPAKTIIADKQGFESWLTNQPENIAVVILAMDESEYTSVSEYKEIAFIKLVGEDINKDHADILGQIFERYGDKQYFGGFMLGTISKVDRYKDVVTEIASGV